MEEMIRCSRCGGHSPADGSFCIECGAELTLAATGPTRRIGEATVYTQPAAPSPALPIQPPPPPPPLPPMPQAAPRQDNGLSVPMIIAGGALALLLVPRFGALILVALGVAGLMMRGMLSRPERTLPLLVLVGFMALLLTGGKLFWPLLIGFFVLRAILGRSGWRHW